MSKYKYIKASAIKAMVKAHNGKRVSTNFLYVLEGFIEKKVKQAADQHDGGVKTINHYVAGYVGIK